MTLPADPDQLRRRVLRALQGDRTAHRTMKRLLSAAQQDPANPTPLVYWLLGYASVKLTRNPPQACAGGTDLIGVLVDDLISGRQALPAFQSPCPPRRARQLLCY